MGSDAPFRAKATKAVEQYRLRASAWNGFSSMSGCKIQSSVRDVRQVNGVIRDSNVIRPVLLKSKVRPCRGSFVMHSPYSVDWVFLITADQV